jgi:hypothetical protein
MKKYLFAVFVFLTVACIERPVPPAGTLTQSQMVQILVDIHIAEAKVGHFSFRNIDSSKALYRRYEQDIFKKHGVDTTTYRKSFEFYLENTQYLDDIYSAVIDSLSYRESIGKID